MSNLKLSKEDEYLLSKYRLKIADRDGYYRVYVNGVNHYLHRYIIGAKKGEIVDHIDRDIMNNRRDNLRIVTKSLNNYNRCSRNKLGKGIYFDKYGDRYRACISHNNKTLKLGSFKDINKAKEAYNKKAIEIYGSDAFVHKIT